MSTAAVEEIVEPYHQTDRFSLYEGDCRIVLPIFPDNFFDSIVTDPPAGISFMGKDWDHHKGGRDQWVAWLTEVMRECFRVLKPGGHALVWAIPRTSHWTGWAIESAGFEVRDRVSHLFGSGFPKSLDVSKAIDAAAGAERSGTGETVRAGCRAARNGGELVGSEAVESAKWKEITVPATDAARQWNGWGTALKPACEDWWLCRKPLEGTVAENVLQHGTGGLNINGCRIETDGRPLREVHPFREGVEYTGSVLEGRLDGSLQSSKAIGSTDLGRWPSNIIHDGSEEVLAGFPETETNAGTAASNHRAGMFGIETQVGRVLSSGSDGTAARFFYCAKASQEDRNEGCEDLPHRVADDVHKRPRTELDDPRRHGVTPRQNNHPTVKPTDLMRYLCRLITPPGGVVLDPFCGSGSTGKAAMLEGFKFVGIELNEDYCQLAQRRIEAVTRQGLLFA